jgi:hypothetical protein
LVFGDVLGALQALAHTAWCLALRTFRNAFLAVLAKAALISHIVAVLDKPPQAQEAPRFPILLQGLTLR